jgi:hypothetical protein
MHALIQLKENHIMKIKYFLIPVLAMFLVTSCKKKKKEDSSENNVSAKKAVAKKPVVKKPAVKKPVVKKPVVKKPAVKTPATPGSITTIAKTAPLNDIGLPPVALAINFQKILTSPLLKGMLDKNKANLVKGLETRDFSTVMKCMNYDASKLYDIVNNIYVFANVETKSAAILVKIKLDAFKMVECIGKNKKLFKTVKFDGKPAIYNNEDKGTSVAINKDTILVTSGPEYAAKIKIGKTDIGKGDVAKYFTLAGSENVKIMVRSLAIQKLVPPGTPLVGGIAKVDTDGVIGFAPGFTAKFGINVFDAKKATQIAGFVKMLLSGPAVTKNISKYGIDPALIKGLVISAKGTVISMDVTVSAADVAKLVATMEKNRPAKGKVGDVKPVKVAPKAVKGKVAPKKIIKKLKK